MNEYLLAAGLMQQFAEFDFPLEVFRTVFLGGLFLLFCAQLAVALAYACILAQDSGSESGVAVAATELQADAQRSPVSLSLETAGHDRLFLGHTRHG